MEEHKHHRSDDPEYIEDNFVRIRFCDERDNAMKDRMNKMESLVERLGEDTRKSNKQLAVIMGVIVFVGAVAGLILQYVAIIHHVKP
jgi:tetrahydromethanopterin S-methyltransferase subunit G